MTEVLTPPQITPAAIQDMATRKYVCEFNYLRGQAQEPLSSFLRYMQYEYMIDNIMLLLKGTLSGRNTEELIQQCHPMGLFDNSTMKLIPLFEASPKGYQDLYQTVLVDTPVGPYFSQFLVRKGVILLHSHNANKYCRLFKFNLH